MKEDKKDNIKEKLITIEDIPKINPNTISKIILLDGTILSVQKESSRVNEQNSKKPIVNIDTGAIANFKLNHIQNSSEKPKNRFSYIEWDFPNFPNMKEKNHSFQRNIENDLKVSKTEQNEDNNKKENSRDSAINRSRKSKNYSFFESKHTSKKKVNQENNESKNTSGIFVKKEDNFNYKEIITNKDNNTPKVPQKDKEKQKDKEREIQKEENKNSNHIIKNNNIKNDINNNKQEVKPDVLNVNNNEKKEETSNKKNKDNLTFNEKIKLIKYGILDYDSNFTGLKSEENNIQKINKIKPLNIIIDKNRNKNEEDLDIQFNKLLNKFNENKTNKKKYDENSFFTHKNNGKEINLNDDINRLNNIIHKNKFTYTIKNENNKGNSYRDLNERINQLKKKTLASSLYNYIPNNNSKTQKMKMLVLPSNFK